MPRIRGLLTPLPPRKKGRIGRPKKSSAEPAVEVVAHFDGSVAPHVIDPNDVWLTTQQAAQLTGLSAAWYERKRWAKEGPPYMRRDRVIRYLRSELLAWWAQSRQSGADTDD